VTTTQHIQKSLDQIAGGQDLTKAIDELLARAQKRIRTHVERALGSRPDLARWEEPDDLMQDVLIRLDRAVRTLKPSTPGKFFALTAKIVKDKTIDLLRHHLGPEGGGRHHQTGGAHQPLVEQRPADVDPPSKRLIDRIDHLRLHEAVDRLPEQEREAWLLHSYLGLTQQQIADRMEVSTKTVQRRILEARKKLASELHDHLND